MRIYQNPLEAVREVERDLFEMGIRVHPQTMQDKKVADDPDYETKELRGYAFKIVDWQWNIDQEHTVVDYFYKDAAAEHVKAYIAQEFVDRVSGTPSNPGNAYKFRQEVWNEFVHSGKFAYTYSERQYLQVKRILTELNEHPDTRQAIITIHSNINTDKTVSGNVTDWSNDAFAMGGAGRVPCSLLYQVMRREGKVDLHYVMRSCDLLTHFPVDIMLALRLQHHFAWRLHNPMGTFTYFTGSLHAYHKDLKVRGIF